MEAVEGFLTSVCQNDNLKANSTVSIVSFGQSIEVCVNMESPSLDLVKKVKQVDGNKNFDGPIQKLVTLIQASTNYSKCVVELVSDG